MRANYRICERCPHFVYPPRYRIPNTNNRPFSKDERFAELKYMILTAFLHFKPNAYYCGITMGRGQDKLLAEVDDESLKLNHDFNVPESCPYFLEQAMKHETEFDDLPEPV